MMGEGDGAEESILICYAMREMGEIPWLRFSGCRSSAAGGKMGEGVGEGGVNGWEDMSCVFAR